MLCQAHNSAAPTSRNARCSGRVGCPLGSAGAGGVAVLVGRNVPTLTTSKQERGFYGQDQETYALPSRDMPRFDPEVTFS
jgi:hypothetical protein